MKDNPRAVYYRLNQFSTIFPEKPLDFHDDVIFRGHPAGSSRLLFHRRGSFLYFHTHKGKRPSFDQDFDPLVLENSRYAREIAHDALQSTLTVSRYAFLDTLSSHFFLS